MYQKVRKAVIPAAGFGTRFLPATKALSKEMLPIIDMPAIEYQIKEAISAGVEEVIIIISHKKQDIMKFFKRDEEFEKYLISKGKEVEAKMIKEIATNCKITFVYQDVMLGTGHAMLCAKEAVGNEPFLVILGDDLIVNLDGDSVSKQMVDIYNKTGCSIIGCQNVKEEDIEKYGIMKLRGEMKDRLAVLDDMVEKPKREEAPSRLACLGRYLLTPDIFDEIDMSHPSKNGEVYLTDAIKTLSEKKDVLVYDFIGRRYDLGDKYGFVEAMIDFSLRRDDIKDKVIEHIKGLKL